MRHDAQIIQQQLSNLELLHPELAEDREAWEMSVESETDLPDFLRQVERRRQEASQLAAAIEETIIELQERQRRFERREKAIRELAFKLMQAADLRKIEMPEATYSLRNGQQKLVGDVPAEQVPEQFRRVKVEVDRAAIKDALKNGSIIPGFELSNGEPSLSVRTK